LDFRICPIKIFYWDLLLKAGADLNRINGKVYLGAQDNTVTLRNFVRQKGQTGMFAQAAAGIGYQPLDSINMHMGYQMYFFGGLALAPDQIDVSPDALSVSEMRSPFTLSANGYVIIHGIYIGLTYSF